MSDSPDPSEHLFKGSLDHHEDSELDKVSTMNLERVAGGKVYFISDIHLGDGTHADIFLRKDEHFLAFLDEVEREAQALCIVGDALDFEQAWYFSRILRAHPEVIGRLTRLTDHMRVIYIYGNHDPDIVLFRDILKWQLCDKIIIDGHILAIHGYEFDSYVGQKFEESSFLSRAMMIYERIFRTWIRMPLRDNYTLSNRAIHYAFYWLVRWSRLQRWLAPKIGFPDWGKNLSDTVDFWTRGVWGDPMGITMPAIDALGSLPRFDTIICGHSHVPGVVPAGPSGTYVNLGSWSFGNAQYGIWDGQTFVLKDWISGRRIRDENYRHIFAGQPDRPFEDWFADQYMGYLRFRGGEEGLRQGVRPRPWGLSLPRSKATPTEPATIDTVGAGDTPGLSEEELELAHRVLSGKEEAPR
ncbi:MAG: metallophosphoesterase [Myxococcota bacterium]|nr:metallophosphoesterase [Myxococcota bacterium]